MRGLRGRWRGAADGGGEGVLAGAVAGARLALGDSPTERCVPRDGGRAIGAPGEAGAVKG